MSKDDDAHLFTMKDIEEELSSINELIEKHKNGEEILSEKKIFDAWIHLNWALKYLNELYKVKNS